ncbi:hypothetical protein [Legionella hackeliae]|uniref:Uncharacterized protein n=1 Tax=Legionella hackeliae TaxID=449 RepID=A0A0A8UQ33_LEGHA|nr:hypothetical protein [Legionella hackeliae]KTD12862.1 hypothetical protein Lhac_1733 [Legionella hackeliae]CEK09167.1 exported protein of unknown function [Legionella hackeliae]STX49076.1 Uncharacterised protein [Legionella hackeliae]
MMFLKNFKCSSIILLLSAYLLSNVSIANTAIDENMKPYVIEFAKAEYQKIKENHKLAPQQQLYQLSMPLLALATLKETSDYEKILVDMEQILSMESTASQIEKPWQLWMMGRIAVAAKLAGDAEKLKQIKGKLTTQLFENDNKDVITGWAFAYLASLDEESYQKCREKLFEYKKLEEAQYIKAPEKEASSYVWTLVMNLYASANAGKEDYVIYLTELKELTDKKTLQDTSLLVPESDYRQWLVSLERYSFAVMKDQSSLDELTAINSPKVDSFDSMLGWANTLIMPEPPTK